MDRPLLFLSYASPDRERVLPYYEWLKSEGFDPWIDCRRLLPGQNWDFEINRAIERSALVIAFLSETSILRRGYVQRELKLALDRMRDRLSDDIYLIPVLLDSVDLPADLRSIHAISVDDPNAKEMILESIRLQLQRLGHAVELVQSRSKICWVSSTRREHWEGLPGYNFELEFLDFESSEYANIHEVSEYIRGIIVSAASSQREVKLEQDPAQFSFGHGAWSRTNSYGAHPGTPVIKGRVLTVQYAVDHYYAGAMHPNYEFQTFSFLLDPLVRIPSLSFVFRSESEALEVIRDMVRDQLLADKSNEAGLDPEWVTRGTNTWEDLSSFVFGEEAIDLLFAPYHVAPYACGPQSASIPYRKVVGQMKPVFVAALELEGILYSPSILAES